MSIGLVEEDMKLLLKKHAAGVVFSNCEISGSVTISATNTFLYGCNIYGFQKPKDVSPEVCFLYRNILVDKININATLKRYEKSMFRGLKFSLEYDDDLLMGAIQCLEFLKKHATPKYHMHYRNFINWLLKMVLKLKVLSTKIP